MKKMLFSILFLTAGLAYAQEVIFVDALKNCLGPRGGNQYYHVKVKNGAAYEIGINGGKAFYNTAEKREMHNVGVLYVNPERQMIIATIDKDKKTTVTTIGNLYFFFVDDAALNSGGLIVSVQEAGVTDPVVVTVPEKTPPQETVKEQPVPVQYHDGCATPMTAANFEKAKKAIAGKSFVEEKMTICKQIIKANCFSIKQVTGLMELFTYEESKLEVAKLAYPKTVDKTSYYLINEAFTYSGSVDDLNKFLETQE